MTPAEHYLERCLQLHQTVADQLDEIDEAARRFAETILAGRLVHAFGSGHSRIMVEEMWPRYGSFPGFNPMVELSMCFYHPIVGPNGMRQAMYLENVPGLADRMLRSYALQPIDSAFIVSTSGCNVVSIELAERLKDQGVFVVALTSRAHSDASASNRYDGRKLTDFADVVLDNGAPVGDAMVKLDGLEQPVAPGSTVGGCMVVNCIKAQLARHLIDAGRPPLALAASAVVGRERSAQIFDDAYDDHAHRLARLYAEVGREQTP